MTMNPAQINCASIKAKMIPGDVAPLAVPEDVNLPLNFASVSNLNKISGTYTPNNDSKVIASLGANDQCNFILLIVDQQAVLGLSNGSTAVISDLCVQRFVYLGLQTSPSGYVNLTLNGATTGPEVPMLQAQACNWTLFYGQAVIS